LIKSKNFIKNIFNKINILIYSEFQFPSLQLLCYHLEASNSHPNFAIDHLKDLASDVDKIIEHYELIDEWFAKDKNETEIVKFYY
jgi:hypothetical protein